MSAMSRVICLFKCSETLLIINDFAAAMITGFADAIDDDFGAIADKSHTRTALQSNILSFI